MASTPTKTAVLRSYEARPGQTFDAASRDIGRAKSTIHTAVNELVAEGRMVRSNCACCGGPTYTPSRAGLKFAEGVRFRDGVPV